MPRKKIRKNRKKSNRRKKEENIFGLDLDIPKIEVPKIEVPSFDLGLPKQKKVTRKGKKREDVFGLGLSNIETSSLDFGIGVEQKKINPNKIPKVKLIGILSRQLSVNQIYKFLIRLGKYRLANDFLSEVEFVSKKYEKMLRATDGNIDETREEKLLKQIIEEIISYIRRDFYRETLPKIKSPKNENDFEEQSLTFLKGILSPIKSSYEKFGLNIDIERQKQIAERERIDLLVTVGKLRIGIELKYNPNKMSEYDHLMAQIDRYIPYLDYLIILSYSSLEPWVIKKIKDKEIEKGKPIKIITPDRVV